MRAVKREKNEVKVLKKLKETLKNEGKIIMTPDMVKFAKLDEIRKSKKEAELKQLNESGRYTYCELSIKRFSTFLALICIQIARIFENFLALIISICVFINMPFDTLVL